MVCIPAALQALLEVYHSPAHISTACRGVLRIKAVAMDGANSNQYMVNGGQDAQSNHSSWSGADIPGGHEAEEQK